MLIVDDLIPKSYQEDIKNLLLSNRFPWYFTDDITFGRKTVDGEKLGQSHPANAHLFRFNGTTSSDFYTFLSPIAHIGADHVNYPYTNVVQCRSFLQYPLKNTFLEDKVDRLHIDLTYDHLVVLYYVLDSDGDTLIVDKQREGNSEEYHYKVEDYNIIQRVTPKQGRAVIFDGKYYHTAEQPSNNLRCIINFNIV